MNYIDVRWAGRLTPVTPRSEEPPTAVTVRGLSELVAARIEHYTALAQGETEPGIATGFDALDRALGGGVKPGKLVVLGARPTVGKTSLAGQIAVSVASAGHTVLILSQEMTSGELVDRFVANAAGVPLGSLTEGRFTDADWGDLTAGAEHLTAAALFVDDTPALTLPQIRAKARQVRRKHGLALLVVDYLQLCASSAAGDRRHHQIEAISRGLKQLAKELGACVLLLSQLNRASLDRSGGEPEMSDLKESGAIEEDADVVLLLQAPCTTEPMCWNRSRWQRCRRSGSHFEAASSAALPRCSTGGTTRSRPSPSEARRRSHGARHTHGHQDSRQSYRRRRSLPR